MAEKCSECNEGCMMQLDKNIRQCNACTSRYVKIESSTPDQEKPHPLDNVLNDLFDTPPTPVSGPPPCSRRLPRLYRTRNAPTISRAGCSARH